MQKHVVRQILFSPAHKPTFCLKVKEPRHHIYSLPRGEILLRNISFITNEKNSKCKTIVIFFFNVAVFQGFWYAQIPQNSPKFMVINITYESICKLLCKYSI